MLYLCTLNSGEPIVLCEACLESFKEFALDTDDVDIISIEAGTMLACEFENHTQRSLN